MRTPGDSNRVASAMEFPGIDNAGNADREKASAVEDEPQDSQINCAG